MKVFILREEDLYSACDCGEGECGSHDGGTVYTLVGVYSSKEKAEKVIADAKALDKKHGIRRGRYYDIEEMVVDA